MQSNVSRLVKEGWILEHTRDNYYLLMPPVGDQRRNLQCEWTPLAYGAFVVSIPNWTIIDTARAPPGMPQRFAKKLYR